MSNNTKATSKAQRGANNYGNNENRNKNTTVTNNEESESSEDEDNPPNIKPTQMQANLSCQALE